MAASLNFTQEMQAGACGYDISMKRSGKTTQLCRIANVYRYVSRAATATVCVHGFASFFQNELCAKKNIAEKGFVCSDNVFCYYYKCTRRQAVCQRKKVGFP